MEVSGRDALRSSQPPYHALFQVFVSARELFFSRSLRRYLIIGLLTNVAGYCFYLLITALGASPIASMTLLYTAGVMFGFFCNRNWAFKDQGRHLPSLIRYMLAYLIGYWINWTLLYVLVDRRHYPHQLVQAFAVILVAAFLFPTLKYFVFGNQPRPPRRTMSNPP